MTSSKKIKVLIVDDSALVQKLLTKALSEFEDIDVVDCASDPYEARDKVVRLKPDVMTLDIEMPRMDGLTFLGKLMKHFPMPVVMVSSVAQQNSENALRALELGAVEIVPKPGSSYTVPDVAAKLVHAIRAGAVASIARLAAPRPEAPAPQPAAAAVSSCGDRIIGIGASTGGVRALEVVLSQLSAGCPPTVVVQHIPKDFVDGLAERLDGCTPVRVGVAKNGGVVAQGQVVISPGDTHVTIEKVGATYVTRLTSTPAVNHARPSVDVLFSSLARHGGKAAMGILLTGMGRDGASGLLKMRQNGAHTVVEASETCVVFGMPRAAIEANAAVKVVRLEGIAAEVAMWTRGGDNQRPRIASCVAAVGA